MNDRGMGKIEEKWPNKYAWQDLFLGVFKERKNDDHGNCAQGKPLAGHLYNVPSFDPKPDLPDDVENTGIELKFLKI